MHWSEGQSALGRAVWHRFARLPELPRAEAQDVFFQTSTPGSVTWPGPSPHRHDLIEWPLRSVVLQPITAQSTFHRLLRAVVDPGCYAPDASTRRCRGRCRYKVAATAVETAATLSAALGYHDLYRPYTGRSRAPQSYVWARPRCQEYRPVAGTMQALLRS